MKVTSRFRGLELTDDDRAELRRRKSGGKQLSARTWRRIRVLELLDLGLSARSAAKAVGSYPREIARVGKRYVARGLAAALSDEPRPRPPKRLDSPQEAAIIAMICGPPPQGRARWTVRLAAEEAMQRGVVEKIGRETIRVVLATHALKPWREKNVVRAANRSGVRGADGGRARAVRAPPRRR